MPAGVVGDHPVTRALECPGAHHDVAASRRQTVQEDDRKSLPRLLAGQFHAVARNRELRHVSSTG